MSDFYITTSAALQKVVTQINHKKIVALDTEFTREKTYYPILSLVQIAVDNKVYIVDCLADIDLQPFFDVIANKEIKKILHSAIQDLQIFYQKSTQFPQNIVDVQLMANFCGIGFNIGYSNLSEKMLGIFLDKKMQRSDWQQRPLDIKQIEYAMNDVLYLEEICLQLGDILQQKKRSKWFEEEMQDFIRKALVKGDENLFKNFSMQKRFSYKTPNQLAKIRSLILWREKQAQQINLPRRHFLEDKIVEEMVMMENFDLDLEDYMLQEIREILAAHNEEEYEDFSGEPKLVMNELQKSQYQRAKNLIAKIAQDEDLKEQFLITSPALKNIVLGKKKVDEIISGWRYFLFGKKLEKIFNA